MRILDLNGAAPVPRCFLLILVIAAGCAGPRGSAAIPVATRAPAADASKATGQGRLVIDARAMAPLVSSAWVRCLLRATRRLPRISPRRLFHDPFRKQYFTAKQLDGLNAARRGALKPLVIDEEYYYSTRYGSPLAYTRALDLAAGEGLESISGRRVFDFGYGKIGHLRLMAQCGARVVGVDVDPSLPVVYSWPGDQGEIPDGGHLTLISGHFPADPAITRAVGTGFDLVTAKNTLKMGYIHPARPVVPPRMSIDLQVTDEQFLRAIFALLRPGGYLVIYNLYPRQNPPDKPYLPWADGQTPFSRSLFESVGFEVLVFDRDDTPFARRMGLTLGWDRGPDGMDVASGLFGIYTVARRP